MIATVGPSCQVMHYGGGGKIEGGHIIVVPPIETAGQWCEEYGVTPAAGVVVLYKAVDAEFKSAYGMDYRPGTVPAAPDWDGGKEECGGSNSRRR